MAGWNLSALFGTKAKATSKVKKPKGKGSVRVAAVGDPPLVEATPVVREALRRTTEVNALPRFAATASDQLNARGGDRVALMRSRLGHAFTPSQPIGDRKMFAGRGDALRAIIEAIEAQRMHVVLYGERGIGKTSLLHMLSQAAAEARYIVVYTSCGADSNFDETFRAAATDIPVLFHSGFSPTAEQAEKGVTLADLLPTGAVSPRQFADLCAKLTGTRVLIVLDEFDRCETPSFRRDVAELIKNLSDRLGRVQLVLAGVAADLTELVQHIPSIRRNLYATRVPRMSDEEIQQILTNGEREVGLVFEPAARDLVVAVSRGSPYIANLLCHHAAHAALAEGRSTVLSSDVVVSVQKAETEFQGRLAKATQQKVRGLASQGRQEDLDMAARTALSTDGVIGIEELQETNQIDKDRAKQVLERLADAGLVQPIERDAGNRYEFGEEGLPIYLWIAAAQQNLEPRAGARAARR